MTEPDDLKDLLPKLSYNKEFQRRKKLKQKKRAAALEDELRMIHGNKASIGKQKKKEAKREGPKGSNEKKEKTVKKTAPAVRKSKLVIGGAETGKKTLAKKKAGELVEEHRLKKKSSAANAKKLMKESARATARSAKESATVVSSSSATAPKPGHVGGAKKTKSGDAAVAAAAVPPPPQLTTAAPHDDPPLPLASAEEAERALIARAIMGSSGSASVAGADSDMQLIREDPLLHSDLAFVEDYTSKKQADVVSADQLLHTAHVYFKELGKREQSLNKVAREHMRRMREVNRRGGDKDGFRYVLPKNVKVMVRQLLAEQKSREGVSDGEAFVDPDELVSTFGGDGLKETSDIPVRRRRRQNRTSSDFYQFQVSKRWTRNAENFLRRSRPTKALFEAKKHQRSIKKF